MNPSKQSKTVTELAELLGARVLNPRDAVLRRVNTIRDAGADEIGFVTDRKYYPAAVESRAGAVLTAEEIAGCSIPQLCVPNVQKALIAALKVFAPSVTPFEGIHPSAVVEPDAQVAPSASIGPGAYIGHEVVIGEHTQIGPNCSIGQRSTIGAHSRLDSSVVVYHDCKIGNYCIIQANSTIGAIGYGYTFQDGRHQLIPHNGGVVLEDGVEIGANTCVDRAKFGNTLVGAGTKIDNQVQIGHNVQIGKLCLIAGQAGLAGSVKLGNGVALGGGVGVVDNLTVGDGAMVGVMALVTSDVPAGQKIWGSPAQNQRAELKSVSIYQKLPELAKEVKQLAKRLEQLESAEND